MLFKQLMIKPLNLVKSSFTLLETLISITILSFVISGFSYATFQNKDDSKTYMLLNDLDNKFTTNDYKQLTKSSKNIKIIINENQDIDIDVFVYEYVDEKIKLIRYEK